ncbi:MAG: DUF169 domain-containing protein [Methanoregula sp.]|jgi:hypothetical protein
MDIELRDRFIALWQNYFSGAKLPITFGFSKDAGTVQNIPPPNGWRCIICQIGRVRNGTSLALDAQSVTCRGGLIYSGDSTERPPGFRNFLSHGIPGGVEGERYKQTPELVDEWQKTIESLPSAGKRIVFIRWDHLAASDTPEVLCFFARPEVLSGLFTLANFDQTDPNGVICPMGAGCSSIIHYPWLEQQKENPRVVLGMFDPSARPCVQPDMLTMAIPMKKFVRMIGFMEESFLITKTWDVVKKKIGRSATLHQKV